MSYQAVIRNSLYELVTDHEVGMKISILQGSSSGSAVYVETQTPISNAKVSNVEDSLNAQLNGLIDQGHLTESIAAQVEQISRSLFESRRPI